MLGSLSLLFNLLLFHVFCKCEEAALRKRLCLAVNILHRVHFLEVSLFVDDELAYEVIPCLNVLHLCTKHGF